VNGGQAGILEYLGLISYGQQAGNLGSQGEEDADEDEQIEDLIAGRFFKGVDNECSDFHFCISSKKIFSRVMRLGLTERMRPRDAITREMNRSFSSLPTLTKNLLSFC